MESKISSEDVSTSEDLILEPGTKNPRFEGELLSGEDHITSADMVKCNSNYSKYFHNEETNGKKTPVIEVIDVKKSYILGDLEVPVLHNINLEVCAGEFLAIMGPSGSGKSTLMNLIGFLDRPTEGRIIIKSLNINKLSDKEVARLRGLEIGFVFQTFNLIPRLTALENVELPTYANKKNGVNTHERAKDLLRLVGLEDRMHHKPGELSGGQSQRVAIARALINDPAILLADEPTGNLDSKTGCEILDIFRKLNEYGRTIIIITHDPEIAGYADRIVLVRDGIIQNKE